MEYCKSVFSAILMTLIVIFIIIGCTEKTKNSFYSNLSMFGLVCPIEQKLLLPLKEQAIESPFSFADYCEEEYDTIYILPPYFDIEKPDFLRLKMSSMLRGYCDSNVNFDAFSTILFVSKGKVEAFAEIERIDADFVTSYFNDVQQVFPFEQMFVIDAKRDVHLYK